MIPPVRSLPSAQGAKIHYEYCQAPGGNPDFVAAACCMLRAFAILELAMHGGACSG